MASRQSLVAVLSRATFFGLVLSYYAVPPLDITICCLGLCAKLCLGFQAWQPGDTMIMTYSEAITDEVQLDNKSHVEGLLEVVVDTEDFKPKAFNLWLCKAFSLLTTRRMCRLTPPAMSST